MLIEKLSGWENLFTAYFPLQTLVFDLVCLGDMPITLPDFKNAQFSWLTLCGEATKAGPELIEWMKGEKPKISSFKTDRGDAHIRLILGGTTEKHVHVDVYSPEIDAKSMKGKSKSQSVQMVDLAEIQASISRLLGQEVEVGLRAGYKAKIAELPETGIIRAFSFDTKMGNVSLKLDGARFSIEGAPIQEISWSVRPDGDIGVMLESDDIKSIIAEDYLTKTHGIVEQAFNIFVLGKAPHEPK